MNNRTFSNKGTELPWKPSSGTELPWKPSSGTELPWKPSSGTELPWKPTMFELNNGIKCIYTNNSNSQSVSILVLIRYGSANDTKMGSAHLLEHLVFKGTKTRPFTIDIMKELNSFGAKYNAFTSKTFTGYYIKSSKMYLEKALDILSDLVGETDLYSNNFQKEFEPEKKIILQELLTVRENPSRYIHELTEKNIFSNKLSKNVEDDINDLSSITLKDIQNIYKKYYVGENIIVSINGNISEHIKDNKIEKLVNDYFHKIPKGIKNDCFFQKSKPFKNIEKKDIHYKNTEKSHILLSFLTKGLLDRKSFYMIEIFNLIFANLTSGRLFQSIREQQTLVYTIYSRNVYHDHLGCVSIQTNTDHENLFITIEAIKKEIQKVLDYGIKKEELELGQNNLSTKILLSMEDSLEIAEYNAMELFYYFHHVQGNNGQNEVFIDYMDRIKIFQSITLEELNTFIKNTLDLDKLIITIIKK